ncbi:MAG: N-acyl homoserine lactonase family protein [bacterium]
MTSLRADRVARLDRLDLGTFDVGPGKRLIPISGWLITTDQGRRLLIDTGFPADYATDERTMAEADGLDGFGRLVGFGPQHTILGALGLHGVMARDISHVLLSHSHIDHVGGLALFRDAEIILSARERAEPRPLYHGSARPMAWPDASYRLLTKTTEICGGLRMIATPGHTPGHMSMLIKTPGQSVVLAIDAINRTTEPAEGFPDAMDPTIAARSAASLFALQRRNHAALICGHEPL